jgi:hypothetical protein
MAKAIQSKLQKLSGEYSAKVKDKRELEAKKKKPFVTDAEVKTINEQIKVLEREYKAIMTKYNELAKLEKTAEEYLDLNKKVKEYQESLTKAEARGEDTASIKRDINKATTRIRTIAPDVERNFPEIKVETPKTPTTPTVKPGPTGTPAAPPVQTPGTPVVTPGPMGTPAKTPTKTPAKTPVKTPAAEDKPIVDRQAEALNVAAGQDFTLPETLFKNIPSLNALLKKYVNTPGMTPDAFRKMLRDDVWYKQNSKEIKERFVQYYNYRDLQASGQAKGTTDYEMQIDKIESMLKKRAAVLGSAAASDPAALRKAAENLYITNRSEDQSFIDDFLAASIRPVGGMIGGKGTEGYSGKALSDYQLILRTARENGFQIKDILPGGATEQQILQGITMGTIDINRILQDARKLAAQGQPQYVRDLLSQGYNLDQVYAPYRQQMAAELDLNPDEIDLNDPTLRSAITEKGDMNIYEFKKALRKDNRWQYSSAANEEVSSSVLNILRDFGFQG